MDCSSLSDVSDGESSPESDWTGGLGADRRGWRGTGDKSRKCGSALDIDSERGCRQTTDFYKMLEEGTRAPFLCVCSGPRESSVEPLLPDSADQKDPGLAA